MGTIDKIKYRIVIIVLLINFSVLNSCNKNKTNNTEEKGISISVERVTFEGAICNIDNEEEKFLYPYEMFIDLTLSNNTADVIYFGAVNYSNYTDIRKYGHFQLIFDNDTINLTSSYHYLDIGPYSTLNVYLRCSKQSVMNDFTTVASIDSTKIYSRITKYELIYVPIVEDYKDCNISKEYNTFLNSNYKIDWGNFSVHYSTYDGEGVFSFETY